MIHKCIHDDHTHPLRKCNICNSPAVAPDQLQTKKFNSQQKYKIDSRSQPSKDSSSSSALANNFRINLSGDSSSSTLANSRIKCQEILILMPLQIQDQNVKRFWFFCSCNVRKINVKRFWFFCSCNSRISTCQEMILILLLLMQKNLMALCQRKSCNSNQRSIQVQRSQSSSTGSLKPRAQKVIRLDQKNAYYSTSRTIVLRKKETTKQACFCCCRKKNTPQGKKKKLPKNWKEKEEEEIKNKEKERMVMGRMGVGIRVEGTKERERERERERES